MLQIWEEHEACWENHAPSEELLENVHKGEVSKNDYQHINEPTPVNRECNQTQSVSVNTTTTTGWLKYKHPRLPLMMSISLHLPVPHQNMVLHDCWWDWCHSNAPSS